MTVDRGLRIRVLVLLLAALTAWLVWREAGELSTRIEAERARQAAAERNAAAERERRDSEARLTRLQDALAAREQPPTSASEVRGSLRAAARTAGVELTASRVQPLLRSPAGTRGAEVRWTAEGAPRALRSLLNALETKGWPLRTERAQLAVRSASGEQGRGILTSAFTVLWPDPDARFTEADAARIAKDPRIGPLSAWLASTPPQASESSGSGEPPETTRTLPAESVVAAGGSDSEAPVGEPAGEAPRLLGFVEIGPEEPARAALLYGGEMALVAQGDRLGDYLVVELTVPDSVLLVPPDAEPLRLTLR